MSAFSLAPLVIVLLGWLAGGAANWAADELPSYGAPNASDDARTSPRRYRMLGAALHYLTLPWYLFRHGICPHCDERRPNRAPLLEGATIIAFGATMMTLQLFTVCLILFLTASLSRQISASRQNAGR